MIQRSLTGLLLSCIPLHIALSDDHRPETHTQWVHYGGSERGLQYSSLAAITPENVSELEEVWRFRTSEKALGDVGPLAFQANPILVNDLLYLSTGSAVVIALNPETGGEVWRHDPGLDDSKGYAEVANRGVSAWTDHRAAETAQCRHRVFVGTLDARLIALDALSGKRCAEFGIDGQIALNVGVRAEPNQGEYQITSPPVIVDDVLVVGSAIGDNRAVASELGIVRGVDARTGRERWRWDPIPRLPADVAEAGWKGDEAVVNGSANAWAPLAADSDLGLVYVPTGSASPDFYGGERQGDNRYANSLVALNAEDGRLVWHQQLVHHDVWDYDLAAQPTLVELDVRGERIPAVLQGTKTGMIFSFDRRDGTPIFAIEERAVPQGGVPGEHLSPTQPFPVAPPPLVNHQPLKPDDAWGMLWFDERSCRKRLGALRSEGIFTPPSVEGTVVLPGYAGGINWGGVAFDPSSQVAVAFAMDLPMEVALTPRHSQSAASDSGDSDDDDFEFAEQLGTPYTMRRRTLTSPLGVPCSPPPWGTLSAVDMSTGTIRWQRPVGTIEDIAPGPVPNLELGVPGMGGPIITGSGVIFIAATMDDYLRAFDLQTGNMLWEGRLPAGGQATPMTYRLVSTDKQYVVIAAGGHPNAGTTPGDYVIAFSLPD